MNDSDAQTAPSGSTTSTNSPQKEVENRSHNKPQEPGDGTPATHDDTIAYALTPMLLPNTKPQILRHLLTQKIKNVKLSR